MPAVVDVRLDADVPVDDGGDETVVVCDVVVVAELDSVIDEIVVDEDVSIDIVLVPVLDDTTFGVVTVVNDADEDDGADEVLAAVEPRLVTDVVLLESDNVLP